MIDQLRTATDDALRKVIEIRYFRSERGFQGQFYCALQQTLEDYGLLNNGYLLEMEYQKSAYQHGMSQRPDIVLHIPTEHSYEEVANNNRAGWALKRQSDSDAANADYVKLKQMIDRLCYSVGFFVNIDSNARFADEHPDQPTGKIRAVAVSLRSGKATTNWGSDYGKLPQA